MKESVNVNFSLKKDDIALIFDNAGHPHGIDYWGCISKRKPKDDENSVAKMVYNDQDLDDPDANFPNLREECPDLLLNGQSVYVLEIEEDTNSTIIGCHELNIEKLVNAFAKYIDAVIHGESVTLETGQPELGDYIIQEAIFGEQRYC